MLRVYEALKHRIMTGDFVPGERLDPARLAQDHSASVTPVRDALHRLTGERLIESWQQEGFRQPLVTEASLKDLYGWSSDLIGLALRHGQNASAILAPQDAAIAYPDRVAALFRHIAQGSTNHEIWLAIDGLNDRLHRLRMLEAKTIEGCEEELAGLVRATQSPVMIKRAMAAYHARRQRHVPILASQLRPREDNRDRL